jgi:LmbE family N-acetylglucosaminyl deacetylase
MALRSQRGPFRFLVRKWDSLSDIDLAVRVLGTEFFKSELVPLPLPVGKLRSVLVIAPHQDDEVIGAGGSLLLASRAGAKIDVLYVTDGISRRLPAYAASSTDVERTRNSEAHKVCSLLGATAHHLRISNAAPRPTLDDLERLSELVCRLQPQVILAPWLLDSPPRHRLVNHLLWLGHHHGGLPDCEVWGYQVHNTLYPNGYVDITAVAERKRELLECYWSQNQFLYRYDHLAMGMAAWNARFLPKGDPVARYVEVFLAVPMREFLRLVESFYLRDLRTTYCGHADVLSGAVAVHQAVTGGSSKLARLWTMMRT